MNAQESDATHEQNIAMLEGLCEGWEDVMRRGNSPCVDPADLRLVRRFIRLYRHQDFHYTFATERSQR